MAYLKQRGARKIWHVYYYDKLTHKFSSFSTGTTNRAEANRLCKDFEAKQRLNLLYSKVYKASELTFSEILKKYAEHKKLPARTFQAYKTASQHFIAAVGNKRTGTYTRQDYLEFIIYLNNFTTKQGKSLSQNTKANYVRHVRVIFEFMLKYNYVKENFIEKLRTEKKDVRPVPDKIIRRICNKLKKNGKTEEAKAVEIIFLLALRKSEYIYLRWEDFDFKNNIIWIRNSKGKRTDNIPMLIDVQRFLKTIDKKTIEYVSHFRHPDSLNRFWRNVNKELNINYKIHDLRRARGSQLANLGVNPYFLMKYMRHTSIKTTMKYYILVDSEKMREDINLRINSE